MGVVSISSGAGFHAMNDKSARRPVALSNGEHWRSSVSPYRLAPSFGNTSMIHKLCFVPIRER